GRTAPGASRSAWRPTARPAPPPGRIRSARPRGRRSPARPRGLQRPTGSQRASTLRRARCRPGSCLLPCGVEVLAVAEGDVAGRGLFRGQAVDVDEAAGAALVEGVALVVGGEVEVVQPGLGAAPGDGGAAAVEGQADVAADVALGVGEEGI